MSTPDFKRYFYERGGLLYWKEIPKFYHKAKVGDEAGYSHYSGYKYVRLGGKAYAQHRVIWSLCNDLPDGYEVDHINRDKGGNRLENLRLATRRQNQSNNPSRGGTSSFIGVSWKERDSCWVAQIIRRWLGNFTCEKEAALVYNYEASKLYGDFPEFNKVFEDVSEELLNVET